MTILPRQLQMHTKYTRGLRPAVAGPEMLSRQYRNVKSRNTQPFTLQIKISKSATFLSALLIAHL